MEENRVIVATLRKATAKVNSAGSVKTGEYVAALEI